MDQRVRKDERLRKRKEIQNVLRQRGIEGKYCIVHIMQHEGPKSRFTVLVRKSVGKAVVRNKAKRRVREILRRIKGCLHKKADIVVRAKNSIRFANYDEIAEEITALFKRQNIIREIDSARRQAQMKHNPAPNAEK